MGKNADTRTLAEIGEKEFLRLLRPYLALTTRDVIVGVGDDAALLSSAALKGQHTILTVDMLVEGTHFPAAPNVDWQRLGVKAMVSNLSDVAAMGGIPRFALVSLGLPPAMPVKNVLDLYEGLTAAGKRFAVEIIGGDTVASPHVVISITLLGGLPEGHHLALRSNCTAGQTVYVSGSLGGSAAGLKLLLNPKLRQSLDPKISEALMARHWAPEARVQLGQVLCSLCPDLGMIDVSDSLFHELSILAEASHVGFCINVEQIPYPPELETFCRAINEPIEDYTLFSGEEYELLFCTTLKPEELLQKLGSFSHIPPVTPIGTVTNDAGVVQFTDAQGNRLTLRDRTYEHFNSPS